MIELDHLTLAHFIGLGTILFCISVAGLFINRKNVIVLLMAIELMLLAVNMNFVAFSRFLGDVSGQIFVFFILTVAAAESAIGLAILVVLFRNRATINVGEIDTLRGEASGRPNESERKTRQPRRHEDHEEKRTKEGRIGRNATA